MISDKFFVEYAYFFFIIAIIEAFLIIFFVAVIFLGKRDDEKDRKKVINDSYYAGKNTGSFLYWKSAYEKATSELDDLKKELRREREYKTNSHDSQLIQQQINRNNTPQSKEYTNQSYFSYADYAARQKEKGIYVNETKNDDGTVKREINFSLESEEPASVPIPPKYEYLEAANGGQFRKLLPSDEKCFFRTWEENGTRKFEFHGNVDKALANINAIFDDVCEIEGKQNGASNIENVEPGILDSKLNVEKLAKIKLT